LNYYWRITATAISFASFGLGGVFMTLFIFPFLRLIPGDGFRKKNRIQYAIHLSFRLFIWEMTMLGVLRTERTGIENANLEAPKLIVANHPTLIDVVFLISSLPRVDCIVKETLWCNPFLKGVVKAAGYIRNDEAEQLLLSCENSLKKGYSLLIFPEGTRSSSGRIGKFHRGAARIAVKSNCNILPVTITCNPSTLTKSEKWYEIPEKRMLLSMKFGQEIQIKDFKRDSRSNAVSARKITEYLQTYYSEKLVK
jgi:1-acyl-sn-glycerol-3-phosphate acyltransferase